MELKVDNITKKYGKFEALSDFSFKFTPGIYGLLGQNGAGKSTLMNIISGVLKPSSGKVSFNGREILSMGKEYRKILGFLPQTSGYYNNFTVYEFLEYVALLKGYTDKKKVKNDISDVLKKVNMTGNERKKLGGLSGGMRQRIGIAQTLLGNPDILIFDEPTAGLDPKERIRFRNIVSELAFNKIVILATHIVSDIELIANNIIIIKHGKMIMSGSNEECVQCLEGKVFEIEISQKDFGKFAMENKVVSVFRKDAEMAVVRFVSDENMVSRANVVAPSLEDLYLYYFGEDD